MGEASGDEEKQAILRRKLDAGVLAVGRRMATEVHNDIQHGPVRAVNELIVCVRGCLEVHAPQNIFPRHRKKLLAQFKFDSQVPIEAFVKGLHERPARVCKEPGFDNFQPGEGFGDEVEHGWSGGGIR